MYLNNYYNIFFKLGISGRKDSDTKFKNSIKTSHGTRYKTGTNYIMNINIQCNPIVVV